MPTLKLLFISLAIATTLGACKPEVPLCETDEQCQTDTGPGNVCVNGTCQECLEDEHCLANRGEDFFCNAGRCDPKPKQLASCSSAAECKEGEQCFKGLCSQPIACSDDTQCGPGAGCINGLCEEGSPEILAAKRACESIQLTSTTSSETSIVNFDFNNHELSIETREVLNNAAECLKLRPTLTIVIEGHADERGTQEYNLALGERRAQAVRSYLSNLGVQSERMTTRTLGSNKPKCEQSTEECYATNRRVEFIKVLKN